jgi:hypothetical protein
LKSTGIVESANLFSAHASFFLRNPRMRQKYLFLFRECAKILIEHTDIVSVFGFICTKSFPNTPKELTDMPKEFKRIRRKNAPNVSCRILLLPQDMK